MAESDRARRHAGVAALRRFTLRATPHALCGLCGEPLPEQHDHVVHPPSRALECACTACALLFDGPGDRRYARIPRDRPRVVDGSAIEAAWAALGLPVSLAFVARWSTPEGVVTVATSPSPLGVIDHAVREDRFDALVEASELVAALRPDVEALLVWKPGRGELQAYVVGIDRCFELTASLRATRAPLARGGEGTVGEFFASLDRAAR